MSSTAAGTAVNGGGGSGEFMLFGVRVVVDSMRKRLCMSNMSQYQQSCENSINNNKDDVMAAAAFAAGYASADDAVHNNPIASRQRKRLGVPWTEEEHKLFLLGLQTVGKGDWRGISRNFVKTRTPTQVASHAQKYFLRRSNIYLRRRRRSSLNGGGNDGNDSNDGNDGDDGDNNGGDGDKNKKKGGGSSDGEGNGDGGDIAEGGDGEERGMNMDCTGQLGFGYRCTYHAGYENGYPVGQLHAFV